MGPVNGSLSTPVENSVDSVWKRTGSLWSRSGRGCGPVPGAPPVPRP